MWPIGFSIKWWVTAGYDKRKQKKKEEEKEMKKDNQYKLSKAMALSLA